MLFRSEEVFLSVRKKVAQEQASLAQRAKGSSAPALIRPASASATSDSRELETEPRDLFGCQMAVASSCERLMRSLLLLQDRAQQRLETYRQLTATRELFKLGRRVREARTSVALDAVAQDIDTWSRTYLPG